MTTFTIVDGNSVATSGLTNAQIRAVRDGVLGATGILSQHLPDVPVTIEILLELRPLGNALATGGTTLSFSGTEGPGQEFWDLASVRELVEGREFAPNGITTDITMTIDVDDVRSGAFFFDPDPQARTAPIPREKFDFISVALHELLHGFGMLATVPGEPSNVDGDGPDLTAFDDNIDLINGERFFTGANAVAANGGQPVLFEPGLSSHIALPADGGINSILNAVVRAGERDTISDVEIGILQDLGMFAPPDMPTQRPGTPANDRFVGTSADEIFDGMARQDTVIFDLNRASTTVTLSGDTVVTSGPQGMDSLISIERLEFLDGTLVFDLSGSLLDYVYRVYSAAFARTPDEAGLRFWNDAANSGEFTAEELAVFFVESDEFAEKFGTNPTDDAFINGLYQNVLLRDADQEGFDFWKGVFETGEQGRDDMLVFFAESPENVERTMPDLDNGLFVL